MSNITSLATSPSQDLNLSSPDSIGQLCSVFSSLRASSTAGDCCTVEQTSEASTIFNRFLAQENARLLYEALVDLPIKEKIRSHSYLDLSDDKALKKQADIAADLFVSLAEFPDVIDASCYLHVPAKKAAAVAQAILKGDEPFDWQSAKILGSGAFGTVEQIDVLDSPSAGKSMKSFSPEDPAMQEKLLYEAEVLHRCAHENVIGLDLLDKLNGIIFLEFAEKGTLNHFCEKEKLTPEILKTILLNIATGCAHMHSKGFIHKDLKLDNVLITSNGIAKIADLGSAVAIDQFDGTKALGTPFYSAPEALTQKALKESCTKLDVWSFGMLIWELLKQEEFSTPFVFPHLNEGKIEPQHYDGNVYMFIYKVGTKFQGFSHKNLEGTLDPAKRSTLDPCGKLFSIMEQALSFNPDNRPTMLEIQAQLSA